MALSGIPPIDSAALPADVRNGTPQQRKSYEAALGFERMLVQQLAKSLSDTTKSSDDESADAATTTYRGLLPDALADGITSAGGLGLARDLVKEVK
jgi:Rod binding domain-containing protein